MKAKKRSQEPARREVRTKLCDLYDGIRFEIRRLNMTHRAVRNMSPDEVNRFRILVDIYTFPGELPT